MNIEKLNRWLMLLSHLGIIGGLILVAVQINQDQALSRAQLYSDATDARIAIHHLIMGQEPAPIVIKSLENPEKLTLAELRVMDAYLLTAVNEFRRLEVMKISGLDVANAKPENLLWLYFANPFAQEWWQAYNRNEVADDDSVNTELYRLITSLNARIDRNDSTLDFFLNLQARVSALPKE